MRQPVAYGLVTAAAVFFVGWITGMGGSFWPNLLFSLVMGVFSAICFALAVRYGSRSKE